MIIPIRLGDTDVINLFRGSDETEPRYKKEDERGNSQVILENFENF